MPSKFRSRWAAQLSLQLALCALMVGACDDSAGAVLGKLPLVPAVANNPTTAAKVELGRHLFYDTRLSVNGTRACGTCHEQAKGFTDGFARAIGATGQVHFHNSSTLTNVVHRPVLAWHNPADQALEDQLLTPLLGTTPIEMGMGGMEDALLTRLAEEPKYALLFSAAFDTAAPWSLQLVQFALAAFERTLQSDNSPFDRQRQGTSGDLSPMAEQGMKLFFSMRAGCSQCHDGPDLDRPAHAPLGPSGFHNLGLYDLDGLGAYPTDATGLASVSGLGQDMGRFRTPTLRNVAVTGPYFHDGSTSTLAEVIAIHLQGGRNVIDGPRRGDGRASPLRDVQLRPRTLSAQEVLALETFLKSLTDADFLANPALANPW